MRLVRLCVCACTCAKHTHSEIPLFFPTKCQSELCEKQAMKKLSDSSIKTPIAGSNGEHSQQVGEVVILSGSLSSVTAVPSAGQIADLYSIRVMGTPKEYVP